MGGHTEGGQAAVSAAHLAPGATWAGGAWAGWGGRPPQPLELEFSQERPPAQVSPDSHFQTVARQLFTECSPGRGDAVALQEHW